MRSRLVSVLALVLFVIPSFIPLRAAQTIQASQTKSETVYITRTGKKFHKAGCQYLRQSSIPIKRSDAVANYSPCSVCRP